MLTIRVLGPGVCDGTLATIQPERWFHRAVWLACGGLKVKHKHIHQDLHQACPCFSVRTEVEKKSL